MSSNLKAQLAQRAQVGNGRGVTINSLVSSANVRQRFEEMLGKKAAGFLSSVISIVNSNDQLKACDPNKVLACAAIAASMDLPINPNLGLAYIVPYKGQPQFQMGYKGYIQLAMRSGQYQRIEVNEVYEGELTVVNRFTGDFEFNPEGRQSDKVVGYLAYFRLINGFEKYLYMSVEQVQAHAKRFSQSYGKSHSPWVTDFDAMAKKTVLKRLLATYGVFSIDMQMQTALEADQATPIEGEDGSVNYEYADAIALEGEYTVKDEDEPETEGKPDAVPELFGDEVGG